MAHDLVMLDEKQKEDKETVAVVIGPDFEIVSNVLIIPMDKALRVAASIIMQVDLNVNEH